MLKVDSRGLQVSLTSDLPRLLMKLPARLGLLLDSNSPVLANIW